MAKKPELNAALVGLTTKKLRGAKYNPRTITKQRLGALKDSMATFGDLSGVVFNIKTKTLVSGHQRLTTLGDAETEIVQHPDVDALGTVSSGYIKAKTGKGTIRIPFRAVSWDVSKEKAANIAANAHGGNFDKDKLKLVIADIERSNKFDIESIGLDPLTLKSLRLPKITGQGAVANAPAKEFKEYGTDLADDSKHVCPKCHYAFS
jgi:hypothetical protein